MTISLAAMDLILAASNGACAATIVTMIGHRIYVRPCLREIMEDLEMAPNCAPVYRAKSRLEALMGTPTSKDRK